MLGSHCVTYTTITTALLQITTISKFAEAASRDRFYLQKLPTRLSDYVPRKLFKNFITYIILRSSYEYRSLFSQNDASVVTF